MYLYDVYGLRIESVIYLPELRVAEDERPLDATIKFAKLNFSTPNIPDRNHYATSTVIELFYEGVGHFSICNGREILVDPLPEVDEGILRVCLLGPALAALLHQRGNMVLHASAVMVEGKAIAFLGEKGSGKSTMAAYLQTRKHRLLSDDIVALDLSQAVKMWPGFPQLKLWPSAVSYFGLNMESMPKIQPNLEKRAHNLKGEFPRNSVAVDHLFILEIGENVEITALRPQQAFIELTRNLYMHRFLHATKTASLLFQQCTHIARSVPMSYLIRPSSLFRLPEVAALIEDRMSTR